MSRSVRRRVDAVDDVVEAAKLREEWSRELRHDEGLTNERADSLAEGVDLLEDRYPEIMGLAVGEAKDFARRRDNKPDAEPLEEAAEGLGEEAGHRSPGKPNTPLDRRRQSPSRRDARSGARSRSTGGRFARDAYRETGIPGTASDLKGIVLSVLGVTVGLSLVYLLLTNAETAGPGRSAVAQIANGFATAVQRLILPVDPLRGAGSPVPTGDAAAAGAPAHSVTPTPRNETKGPLLKRNPRHVFDVPHLGN
ncbi:MAG: hypothetical protein ACJ75S_08610 [Solirubrobacterales bacterium]